MPDGSIVQQPKRTSRREPVRYVIAATLAALLTTAAYAQRPTCILQAVEKKLAGPARTNFMHKCQTEVESVCANLAEQRKLEGPARSLFLSNCVNTYVGVKE
jgi:hypothetical protein